MNLSSGQLALLLDEVAAMADADRPLAIGLAELNHPSLGRIGRAAGILAKKIESGQSPEVAFAAIAGICGKQAAAALRSLQATGSAEPVIRLADALRRQSDMRSQLIVALVYPLITTAIAYIFVSFGVTTLVIQSWPTELVGKQDSTRVIGFCHWLRDYFWLPPLVIGVVAMVLLRLRSSGTPLPKWFSKAADCQAWSTFCELLAMQITADVPLSDAVNLAADATGRETVLRQVREERGDLAAVPPMIGWLLSHAANYSVAETSQELRVLADWYRHVALRRSRFWVQWVPTIITAVVGGGSAFLYCWLVLRPLFDGMIKVAQ